MTLALATVDVWSTLFSFVFFLFGAGMWFLTVPPEGDAAPSPLTVMNGRPAELQAEAVADLAPHAPRYSRFAPK
jgi:hypothetical protein